MPAVPVPRLDAGRVPHDAAAGAGDLLRRALEGRRLRLPADRAAAVPGRRAGLPDADPRARAAARSSTARRRRSRRPTRGSCSATRRSRSSASSCSGSSPSTPRAAAARARSCRWSTTGSSVAPLFFIIALLAERAGGSEDIRDMGGLAFRAPVLAALFLIVGARDAGDAGLGELRRRVPDPARPVPDQARDGDRSRSAGVAMASVYMLRHVHPHDAQPARAGARRSRELTLADALVIVPLVLAHPRFALYPQGALSDSRARRQGRHPGGACDEGPAYRLGGDLAAGRAHRRRLPRADGRAAARPPSSAPRSCPALPLLTLGVAAGLGVWQWGENTSVIAGALAIDDLTLALLMIFAFAGVGDGAAVGALAGGGGGGPRRVPRAAAVRRARHGRARRRATNLVSLFLGFELLSIPLYVLCATELRREHSLESGLKYLIIGSLGSAVLLYGLALLYGATGSTDFADDRRGRRRRARRPAVPDLARADRHRPRVQGVGRAVPPVDAGRL